ncbi:ethanolamine ammonia-lyase subunit EutB [Mangrovicoccus ximenensis]|uniref:ethanolamine ammonia-lyase subunit EutB n=1 Tax=Mangrovicoccus ximenensis TaxID=1911570 RepID=UPI000D3C71A4|nr:ethanolamine ammonia-lyase subunit EutB [Mangrovicoccus ximenensis]
MPVYSATAGGETFRFGSLAALMAAATPARSGDQLAGIAAETEAQRVAARYALADLPLAEFLNEALVPYETDEVTRLILDTQAAQARRRAGGPPARRDRPPRRRGPRRRPGGGLDAGADGIRAARAGTALDPC